MLTGTGNFRFHFSLNSSSHHPTKKDDGFMTEHPSEIYLESSPRSPTAPYRWPPESEERRSRALEFYGFVAWTSTYLLFVLYILWAILPDQYIVRIGITWYPNRYVCCTMAFFFLSILKTCLTNYFKPREWAILFLSWTIIVVLLTYIFYFAIAIRATPSFDEMSAISGTHHTHLY